MSVQVSTAPGGGVNIRRKVTGDGAPTAQLPFTAAEFWAFLQGAKAGEFDHLVPEALRGAESATARSVVGDGPGPVPTRIHGKMSQ